jgi:hypothetical protein
VTDHGSLLITGSASSPCGAAESISPNEDTPPAVAGFPRWPENRPGPGGAPRLCCRVCGRVGRFIDPFPPIPRRR